MIPDDLFFNNYNNGTDFSDRTSMSNLHRLLVNDIENSTGISTSTSPPTTIIFGPPVTSSSSVPAPAPVPTVFVDQSHQNDKRDGHPNQFIPFLLWYLLLVLCCIIPTCCAYRRRRLLEQRLTLHHTERMNRIISLQQQQQQENPNSPNQVPDDAWNLLPYLYYQHQIRAQLQQQQQQAAAAAAAGGGTANGQQQQPSIFASLTTPSSLGFGSGADEETLRTERICIFRKELLPTTMIVQDENLERCSTVQEIDLSNRASTGNITTTHNPQRQQSSDQHDQKSSDNNEDSINNNKEISPATIGINQNDKKEDDDDCNKDEKITGASIDIGTKEDITTTTILGQPHQLFGAGTGALEHHTTLDEFFLDGDNADDDEFNASLMTLRLPKSLDTSQLVPIVENNDDNTSNNNNINDPESNNAENTETNKDVINSENNDSANANTNDTTIINTVNADRTVPGLCAICLGMYEAEDSVTWSPNELCQHAFHTDCILEWLSKKAPSITNTTNSIHDSDSTKCPLCRTEFCPSATASIVDTIRERHGQQQQSFRERYLASQSDITPANFIDSFTQALAMSHFFRVSTSITPIETTTNDDNNTDAGTSTAAAAVISPTNGTPTSVNAIQRSDVAPTTPLGSNDNSSNQNPYPVITLTQAVRQQQAVAHASLIQQLQLQAQQQLQDVVSQQQQQQRGSRRRFFSNPFSTRSNNNSRSNSIINNNAVVLPLVRPSTTATDSNTVPTVTVTAGSNSAVAFNVVAPAGTGTPTLIPVDIESSSTTTHQLQE